MEEEFYDEDDEERIGNGQRFCDIEDAFEKLVEKQNYQLERLNKNVEHLVTILGEISGSLSK